MFSMLMAHARTGIVADKGLCWPMTVSRLNVRTGFVRSAGRIMKMKVFRFWISFWILVMNPTRGLSLPLRTDLSISRSTTERDHRHHD